MAGTGSPPLRRAFPAQARTEMTSGVSLGKALESLNRATPAVRVPRSGSVETSGKCDRLKSRKVVTLRTTRRLPPPAFPVIVLTNLAQRTTRLEAIASGADLFLSKTFTEAQLLAALRQLLPEPK